MSSSGDLVPQGQDVLNVLVEARRLASQLLHVHGDDMPGVLELISRIESEERAVQNAMEAGLPRPICCSTAHYLKVDTQESFVISSTYFLCSAWETLPANQKDYLHCLCE